MNLEYVKSNKGRDMLLVEGCNLDLRKKMEKSIGSVLNIAKQGVRRVATRKMK